MLKQFSCLKILIIFFLWGGELSYDSFLFFFCYFFDGGSGFNYCCFLGGGTGRGVNKDRRGICEGRARSGQMALLSAVETTSFFKASLSLFWSKLSWFLLDVDIHGVGVSRGDVPDGGRGVECDGGSG